MYILHAEYFRVTLRIPMLVKMIAIMEKTRQRMFALHDHSLQPAALRVGHRSTRLTRTYQYRAAQLLRLAEEKGVKTLGNTWYVNLLFSVSFNLLGIYAMDPVRSIRRAIPFKCLVRTVQPRDLGPRSQTSITRQPFASSRSVVTEHFRSTMSCSCFCTLVDRFHHDPWQNNSLDEKLQFEHTNAFFA